MVEYIYSDFLFMIGCYIRNNLSLIETNVQMVHTSCDVPCFED